MKHCIFQDINTFENTKYACQTCKDSFEKLSLSNIQSACNAMRKVHNTVSKFEAYKLLAYAAAQKSDKRLLGPFLLPWKLAKVIISFCDFKKNMALFFSIYTAVNFGIKGKYKHQASTKYISTYM